MKTTHKLLAVMICLGSAQASAESPQARAERLLQNAKAELARARTTEFAYVKYYLTTPRRLASGAPACGNVMGKGERPECTEELADREHAQRADEVKAAFARTAKMHAKVHEATRTLATVRHDASPIAVARR